MFDPLFDRPDSSCDLKDELVSLASSIETHAPSAPHKNVRRHRRLAMPNAKAMVKSANADEEVVELIDVSRGGACFRSEMVYSLGTWVRIAAPCTVGAANIFVMARVVRAKKARIGREYGVEYVETNR